MEYAEWLEQSMKDEELNRKVKLIMEKKRRIRKLETKLKDLRQVVTREAN